MTARRLAVALAVGAAFGAQASAVNDADRLHAFAVDAGGVVRSERADTPVNPASVVKVATTLWALDRLGPNHRYETSVGLVGAWDRGRGVLDGDLVIRGGGDPDLQWENGYLIARELNRLGLARVEGRLRVEGVLWFGWERGVENRAVDPVRRGERMGRRLLDALDPARWDRSHENAWRALCARRGWNPAQRPRVVVTGGVRVGGDAAAVPVLVHRSNPLTVILRRFNVYSNNDIVRVADGLGSVAELESFVRHRLGATGGGIELATASGERRNRMTARQMVGLLAELADEAAGHGIGLRQLLPVIGCDPGATRRMFPALAAPERSGSVVCKTGTLTDTDGGVAVLAGSFTDPDGGRTVFAVAAPRAGGQLQHWRTIEQRWLLALIEEQGGAVAEPCGPELPFSDELAGVEVVLDDSVRAE